MRDLSPEEKAVRDRRKAEFDDFLAERMPVLASFAEALELENPPMIVADPQLYVPKVDEFLEMQDIQENDREWIILRLGFLIGEVLVQRLGGCWLLNDNPDSRTFLRYVVGQFAGARTSAMVDPFEVADVLTSQKAPRHFSAMIEEVVAEVVRALA